MILFSAIADTIGDVSQAHCHKGRNLQETQLNLVSLPNAISNYDCTAVASLLDLNAELSKFNLSSVRGGIFQCHISLHCQSKTKRFN